VLNDPVNLVDPEGLMTKKINPTEKIANDAYCTAWIANGMSGCDKVAFESHQLCLTLASPLDA